MLTYATLPGDIDQLVADDHAVVARQLDRLEAGEGDRRVLADQVSFELALHATGEEQVLYAALREAGLDTDDEHARAEHQQMKELLVSIDRAEPGSDEFETCLARLAAIVRAHVEEEEHQMLPELRRRLGASVMADLGRAFLAAKRAAPTRAHPHAPDHGMAQRVAGLAAKALDATRDTIDDRGTRLATDGSHRLDPQAQRLLDAFSSLTPLPPEILEPDQARAQPTLVDAVHRVLADSGRSTEPEPVATVDDRTIPGPGGDLVVRVYRPAVGDRGTDGTSPMPMLMWIHGGGWVLYDLDTYDASCRGLANKAGAIVVSPAYRRAPEHPFPAAHDDVLAAYRWMRDHADELGGDRSRLAIGGESVGGNMAAATCVELARRGEALPCCQILVYPLTTAAPYGASMIEHADARPLDKPLLSWMAMHAFEGVPDAARDARVALLDLGPNDLDGLPPALVITAERDPLRDQGREFARHLEHAGVPTSWRHFDGVMHEFFGASAVLDAAELAQREAADHLRRSFATAA